MLRSRGFAVLLLAIFGFTPCLYVALGLRDRRILCNLVVSTFISAAGFVVTVNLIPILKPVMLRANLFGMDINKRGKPLGFSDDDNRLLATQIHMSASNRRG